MEEMGKTEETIAISMYLRRASAVYKYSDEEGEVGLNYFEESH